MTDFILQVNNLCKSFGAVEACRNLFLSVERGHIHALIGPNGAGKTTVLNLLSGELKPDSGTIFLNDERLDHLPIHKRAMAGLGRSFQITSIFENLSVSENMALAILAGQGHNYRRVWRMPWPG